jgi:hypothetical protein
MNLLTIDISRRFDSEQRQRNLLSLECEYGEDGLPSRLASDARETVRASLAAALEKWKESEPHMARARRLAEDLADVDRKLASLDHEAAMIRGAIDDLLLDGGKDPSKLEGDLEDNRVRHDQLTVRKLALGRSSAEAAKQFKASLLFTLGMAASTARAKADDGWRAARGKLEEAITLLAVEAKLADNTVAVASDRDLVQRFLDEAGIKLPADPPAAAVPAKPVHR